MLEFFLQPLLLSDCRITKGGSMNTPSAAAQIIISVIPIVGIIMGSVVIFLYMIFTHKQKMLMIEKGISRRIQMDIPAISLFAGCSMTGVGLGLTILFVLKEGISYGSLAGIIPLFLGLSIIVFYAVWKRSNLR